METGLHRLEPFGAAILRVTHSKKRPLEVRAFGTSRIAGCAMLSVS